MHFFDIGANVGQTFDQFLSQTTEYDGWTIWCFEPSPRHFAQLLENCARYRDRYIINICPFGIGEYSKLLRFYEKDDPMGDSFEERLWNDHEPKNINNGYTVIAHALSIQEVIDELIPEEDSVIVKLDVEGSEYGILESLALDTPKQIKKLLVEWHNIGSPHDTPENLVARQHVPVEGWYL